MRSISSASGAPRAPLAIALGLLLVQVACAPAAPQAWQKAGASEATVAADTEQCRGVARQQVARLYPYGATSPTLGGAGMVASQQQSNIDRDSARLQMFNECMENKGYTRPPEPR